MIEETSGKIIQVDIEEEMKKSYLDYSMSVIVGRALPDVRDGLKPVHRRILYAANETGLTPDKPHKKSATIVGDVLGSYHPHGDQSVYDAMVRLAQDFSMRYPLIDGHGNFGSVDGDPPAAYRYTEARMSRMALYMLQDIEKDTIDWTGNYDDTKKEPVVLPSRFPNLLCNGSVGIAVGMATNIPPHNLREVADAIDLLCQDPDTPLEDLMEKVKGPDFPTGGIIMGRAGIRAAYATGRGRIILRSRTEIEEYKDGFQRIIVTEIPYMVNKARLIESIADLVKDKRVDQIRDLRDESDRDGLRIVIELKRDANAQLVLNQLFTYTQLQDTVGVIMLALDGGVPKVMNLREMLVAYVKHQESVILRRTKYDLNKAREREHIVEGLKMVIDHTDEVIQIIRKSKDQPDAKQNLMDRFGISEAQSGAIVAMRLGQLSGMEQIKIEEELQTLRKTIEDLLDILNNEHRLLEIVREELNVVREKYGDDRRTDIQAVSGELDIEDLIPDESSVITLTHFGYVKRQASEVYKTQRRGGRGISGMTRREEDFVEELFVCNSHDYVLFFTDKGRMYRIKAYEIPEASRVSRGTNIVNILPMQPDEKITSVIKVTEMDEESYLVMVTRQGIIKRTQLGAYRNVRKSGIIALSLDEGDELAWVRNTSGSDELLVATRNGMAIRFAEEDVRPMGRTARGVKAMTLAEDDRVVGMVRVHEDADILTVAESGKGRRTPPTDYRLQSRGGKGVQNYNTEKNGLVAGLRTVGDEDDVIMITDDGVIIRIHASDVAKQSRYGSGVRAMRVAEGSKVVTLARVPHEDEEEEAEGETNQGETPEGDQTAEAPTEE